ncbi:MAG: sulfur oxidation c-type cytochrome SoxX [Pseudooceanicola sp.]
MRLTATAIAAALVAGVAYANPIAPMDVSYSDGAVDESLTGVAGDAANGANIVSSKKKGNCIACHEVSALKDFPFHGEVGPNLDAVGDTWSEAELRGIVSNAKMTFDGTVMPAFYKTSGYIRPGDGYTGKAPKGDLPPILSAQDIEDVVAFLKTLKE